MIEALLGPSLVFGTLAILWMHARGVLALAVGGRAESGQPGNQVWEAIGRHAPQEIAYAVPLIILGIMAAIWWPPVRKRMFGVYTHIQRGTPEGERPWHLPLLPSLFPFFGSRPDQPNSEPSSDANRPGPLGPPAF